MPERDITGRASDRAARVLFKAIQRIQKTLPLGPGQVKMSPSELRENMGKMRPDMMQALINQIGPERLLELMKDKNGQI
jgi:hypothetical protein